MNLERARAYSKARKKLKKKKTKTPAQLADECAVLLQKIVRMKAAIAAGGGHIKCVTCGKLDDWKSMQGGHYISRGKSPTKLVEEQIHPQCPRCNCWGGGEGQLYTLYMIDMYGREFVDELHDLSRQKGWKWNRADLEDLRAELKQRIKQYEGELL